jgi:hypothetical protein
MRDLRGQCGGGLDRLRLDFGDPRSRSGRDPALPAGERNGFECDNTSACHAESGTCELSHVL